jgi:5-methylcytosine-specific restriction protein A
MYHDPVVQRLYKTIRWQIIRRIQLAKESWCAECLRANIYTQATDVDHIKPHRGNQQEFFRGPFQSLCHACHSSKTASEVLNR